jgi:hypothetical protein
VCTKFLVGFVTAGFVLSPFAYAADRPQKKNRVDNDMAQAIAFERQKDAAAARQARIEAKHPTVTYSNSEAERSADRDASKADKDGEGQSKQEKRK